MRRNKGRQRGIVLVAICLCLMLMVAGLGLGIDLSRLLAAQTRLRADAEAVALAAVLELDGTSAGLERARIRAAETWQRHGGGEGSARFAVEFSATTAGPWYADPVASDRLGAARITAHSTLTLTLLRSVVREQSLPIDVAAYATQVPVERVDSGMLPLADDAGGRILEGLTVDVQPAAARLAILKGLPFPVRMRDSLPVRTSAPLVERNTLLEMVPSDTDPVSPTYREYSRNGRGNGRRLILLPVVDDGRRVAEFAAFLLLPGQGSGAERVGGYLAGSRWRAQAATGAWRAEVVR